MDEEFLKEISAQLRKPHGEFGYEVAQKMNESNRAMNLTTINAMELCDNDTVVEIGMSNGFFVSRIIEQAKNITYWGFDHSQEMVEASNALNKKLVEKKHATFEVADIQKLPLENNSINKIFTVNTLYFWDDIKATLNEFRRVLKPDGMLLISIRPEACMKAYPSNKYSFEYFTPNKVSKLLTKNGFSVQKVIEEKEPEVEVMGKKLIPEFAIIIAQKS